MLEKTLDYPLVTSPGAWRPNQSILKEINPEYLLEEQCLSSSTLATWCEKPTHWKRPWCWERLRARGEEGARGWDGWMASPPQWTWIWANPGHSKGQERLVCCSPWCRKSCTQLSDWTIVDKNHHLSQESANFFCEEPHSKHLALEVIQPLSQLLSSAVLA